MRAVLADPPRPRWPSAAFLGVDWIVTHLVEVIATSAVCGALAVAAVVALMRWADRRDARHAATRPLLTTRAAPSALPRAERPAIAPASITVNVVGVPSPEQAEVIRRALGS